MQYGEKGMKMRKEKKAEPSEPETFDLQSLFHHIL